MNDFPWLTTLVVLPILGAVAVMALPRGSTSSTVGGSDRRSVS